MTENYRKTVYCEVEFLKESLSQIDKNSNDEVALQKRRLWNSIVNLLLSPYINLFLDISEEEFSSEIEVIESGTRNAQLSDFEELLLNLDYKQKNGNLHIKCLDDRYIPIDVINDAEHINANAIFLTNKDTNICEDFSGKYGISVLTSKKLDVNKQLFEDADCAVAKDERSTNWHKILQGKCNTCNAMIIIDNYILSDTNVLDENLRGILQVLLPDSLQKDLPFHLSVFTNDLKRQSKDRLERVKNIVHDLRPNLSCEVSIFKNETSKFHDRTIITNNLWIGCGGGFDLFKKGKSDKMTVVNIVNPYLTDTMQWAKKAYSNLVRSIKKVISNKNEYINDSYPAFYLGTGVNRLTE